MYASWTAINFLDEELKVLEPFHVVHLIEDTPKTRKGISSGTEI